MAVPTRFRDSTYISKLYYQSPEELEAILNGDLFKTQDFSWYCRSVEFDVRGDSLIPKNLVCIEKRCTTSVVTKRWEFCTLEQSSSAKVYHGEGLKKKIYSEISSWMKNINPKTRTAFSGKRFDSYIYALPREFLIDDAFCEKVGDLIRKGAIARIKTANFEEIKNIQAFKKHVDEVLAKAQERTAEGYRKKIESSVVSSKKLEEARQNAIKEIAKSGRKGSSGK